MASSKPLPQRTPQPRRSRRLRGQEPSPERVVGSAPLLLMFTLKVLYLTLCYGVLTLICQFYNQNTLVVDKPPKLFHFNVVPTQNVPTKVHVERFLDGDRLENAILASGTDYHYIFVQGKLNKETIYRIIL